MTAFPQTPYLPLPISNGGAGQQIKGLDQNAAKLGQLGDLTSSFASQALNDAFDPNKTTYNADMGALTDSTNSQEALRGFANTPYGAAVTGNVLGNFQNSWQTAQVGREATGMNTAVQSGTPYTQAGQLLDQAGQLNIEAVQNMLQAYGLAGSNYASAIQALAALTTAESGAKAQQQNATIAGQLNTIGNGGSQSFVPTSFSPSQSISAHAG